MKLVKVGDLIHNHLGGKSTEVSYVMVDMENKYYKRILDNKEFVDKYSIQKCKGIVHIETAKVDLLEINQIVTMYRKASYQSGFIPMQTTSKIIEIIDNLIITDSNLFIVDDISFYRDKILTKLGI
jgi:thymidine kinase